MNDIKDVTLKMEECRRMGVKVLGPDVNESFYKFAVNKKGEIRFGLGAVKGVGEAAVHAIVNERKENGNYISFEDFVSRVNLKSANKRTIESIVAAGGFDLFHIKRSQYFAKTTNDSSYIEQMIKFGNKVQASLNSNQFDMFGDMHEASVKSPSPPDVDPWGTMQLLSKEKEVVGIYLSGHPLDDYQLEVQNFCNADLSILENLSTKKGKELRFAGVVTNIEHRETKKGKPFGIIHLEDYKGSFSFYFFSDDYIKYKAFFTEGWLLHITGKIQKKFYNDDLEFKVTNIDLLSEIIDKEVRDVVLRIDINDINESNVQPLYDLIKLKKGKHSLVLNLTDQINKYDVDLLSRKYKINLDNEFYNKLATLKHVNLRIKS